ncbi:MAG: signal recognition particle protein [Candidatus Sulfotelmatobacter sp.]|jgi:signal recognition particle subunit SRP54
MFENLQEKLQRAFKSLRGQARLTEENIDEALREIRLALLEADVNFKVVKQLIDQIRAKAVGQEVLTALSPGEQVIKIVRDELIEVLGKDTARMKFASQPPTVVLMAGLQGSGKTTTSGKLAHWLKNGGHRPLLVSVDVYRPAAREQLKIVAQAVKAQIYEGHVAADAYAQGTPDAPVRGGAESPADEGVRRSLSAEVERLAREARREAVVSGCDVLIVDTAGRLHIDEQLMDEMQSLKKLLNPSEILFVADAMTGQDAVNSADEFHKKLSLTGVVLTKMDGDARGGAALSIRQVTGQPIKFIGVGEKYDALEPFHPDRIVSRILGMGDILSLIERAEQQIDKKKAAEMATKALTGGGFSLEDFRDQLRHVKKMGSIKNLMGMMPSIGPFSGLQKAADNVDEGQINRVEAIINSMTAYERNHHEVINGSRRKRIARGSGTSVQEVNNLLRQYAQMKKMFKQMGKASFARRLAGMKLPGM